MVRLLEPWRTRLLWLSLGLNLFAAALVGTAIAMHKQHDGPSGPPGFDMLVRRIAGRLDPADAEAFRAAMAKEQPWYDLGRRKIDEAREAVSRAVGREPYDPAATAAALQAMQEQMRESGTRFDESLALAVGRLSQGGRTQLAESFRHGRP